MHFSCPVPLACAMDSETVPAAGDATPRVRAFLTEASQPPDALWQCIKVACVHEKVLIDSGDPMYYSPITIENCLFPSLAPTFPVPLPAPYVSIPDLLIAASEPLKISRGSKQWFDLLLRYEGTKHIVLHCFWWQYLETFGIPMASDAPLDAPDANLSSALRRCYDGLVAQAPGQGLTIAALHALLRASGLHVALDTVVAALARALPDAPAPGADTGVPWATFAELMSACRVQDLPRPYLVDCQRQLFSHLARRVADMMPQVPLDVRDHLLPTYIETLSRCAHQAFLDCFTSKSDHDRLRAPAFRQGLHQHLHRWLTGASFCALAPGSAAHRPRGARRASHDTVRTASSARHLSFASTTRSSRLASTSRRMTSSPQAPLKRALSRSALLAPNVATDVESVPDAGGGGAPAVEDAEAVGTPDGAAGAGGSAQADPAEPSAAPLVVPDPRAEAESELGGSTATLVSRQKSQTQSPSLLLPHALARPAVGGGLRAARVSTMPGVDWQDVDRQDEDLAQNLAGLRSAFKAMQRKSRQKMQDLQKELALGDDPCGPEDATGAAAPEDEGPRLLHMKFPKWFELASTQHGPPPMTRIQTVPLHLAGLSPCVATSMVDRKAVPRTFQSGRASAIPIVDPAAEVDIWYKQEMTTVQARADRVGEATKEEIKALEAKRKLNFTRWGKRRQHIQRKEDEELEKRVQAQKKKKEGLLHAFHRLTAYAEELERGVDNMTSQRLVEEYTKLLDMADAVHCHEASSRRQREYAMQLALRVRPQLQAVRKADSWAFRAVTTGKDPKAVLQEFDHICRDLRAAGLPVPEFEGPDSLEHFHPSLWRGAWREGLHDLVALRRIVELWKQSAYGDKSAQADAAPKSDPEVTVVHGPAALYHKLHLSRSGSPAWRSDESQTDGSSASATPSGSFNQNPLGGDPIGGGSSLNSKAGAGPCLGTDLGPDPVQDVVDSPSAAPETAAH